MMINDQQNPPIMRQPSAASSTNLTQHHAHPPPHPPPYDAYNEGFAAKRMRKLVQRRAVDYTSTAVKYLQVRMWQRDARDRTVLQPTKAAVADMLPSVAYSDNPSTSFAARFVHASTNKNKCSINRVVWTPSGRRLITGSQSGEFTLWNGQAFNFEMILQAHDKPVRSMVWSHNENWMVTGDDGGSIKYWQNNMNNVKVNQSSHKESVRDLSFSSTDLKFCSCSDDTTVKVWDFARCQEESSLTGHGWDVKCADWHPKKSLLASGGKDNLVKLWDAKSGKELCSFHGHKNIVLSVKWNQNGNWLLTASKDQIIKLYDIRSMKELESFRGHQKDVTALAWHPFHEEYFVSGSYDGSIFHWLVGHDSPQVEIPNAHEGSVWDLAWHPIGYLLCSGSHDHTTKFWCRNRPGDTASDRYTGYNPGYGDQYSNSNRMMSGFPPAADPPTPGPFASGLSQNQGTIPGIGVAMPTSTDDGERRPIIPGIMPSGGAPPLPPGPPPSHLVQGQQQNYQQFQPQQQQFQPQHQQQFQPQHQQQFQPQQQFQQPQMGQMPLQGAPNFNQLQPPSNFQMLPHQHMQRPPPGPPTQGQPLGMPSTMAPMSMQQNPMGMQGSGNQMMAPMGQGHIMGMNQMQSGPQTTNMPQNIGAFQNAMPNIQGGVQNFMFNRPPQMGQMPQIPGLNNFQPGMMGGGNMGLPPPPQPPLPPGPAPK